MARNLRGKMNADEFRDCMLRLNFYKYLSERLYIYSSLILAADEIDFANLVETTDDCQAILAAVAKTAIDELS